MISAVLTHPCPNTTQQHMNVGKGVASSLWIVTGKVSEVIFSPAKKDYNLAFRYDPMGNRIAKIQKPKNWVDEEEWTITWYARDAQGNVLAVYTKPTNSTAFAASEFNIYGSSRIGMVTQPEALSQLTNDTLRHTQTLGYKVYEFSNHLGNVLTTFSDRKIAVENISDQGHVAWYTSEILSSTDYYPFGFQMPGRVYEADGYRYGFNGMEKDDELKGSGNSYDFGARIYDPRVGRWLAVDPFFYKVPSMTPYRFGFCSPLTYKDINGLLEAPLFGTVLYYEHVVKKIVKSFIQKAIKSLGHKRQEYNYAFESIQYLPPKTTEQKQAESNGMLIVVTSNFFKIRSVGSSPHLGVDFRAKEGTNVYSFGDGVVVSSGEADGIGKFVVIEYSNGDKVRFGHLSSINEFKKGEKVLEGQIIGKSGKTGGNYAAHLHVDAVDKDGRLVDPLTRSYGTTSNKEFFEKFGGDALKLKEYKEEKIKESKEMQQAILSVQLKKDEISRHDRIPYVKNQTQQ